MANEIQAPNMNSHEAALASEICLSDLRQYSLSAQLNFESFERKETHLFIPPPALSCRENTHAQQPLAYV